MPESKLLSIPPDLENVSTKRSKSEVRVLICSLLLSDTSLKKEKKVQPCLHETECAPLPAAKF